MMKLIQRVQGAEHDKLGDAASSLLNLVMLTWQKSVMQLSKNVTNLVAVSNEQEASISI